MENFIRVINPGTVPHWEEGRLPIQVFIKIEYKDGRLSLSGVEGPMRNGDAVGGCGQIVDSLTKERGFLPTAGGFWLLHAKRLREVWERWHLNDMRPECEHQRVHGWRNKGLTKVKIYNWRLTSEALRECQNAEDAAKDALKAGKVFKPTKAQTAAASRPWSIKTLTPEAPKHYEAPSKALGTAAVEEKTLGWLTESEHPDGLLCRPCEDCGYKYGSRWLTEEVPEEVLRFLYELPEVDRAPAWV